MVRWLRRQVYAAELPSCAVITLHQSRSRSCSTQHTSIQVMVGQGCTAEGIYNSAQLLEGVSSLLSKLPHPIQHIAASISC